MPSVAQSYEVILDFTNDTHDSATVQLLRDYGCRSNRTVLLNPGETVSLVLDAGDTYKYTLKTKTKVVNITYVLNPTYPQIYCDQSPPCLPQRPSMERHCLWSIPSLLARVVCMAAFICIPEDTH